MLHDTHGKTTLGDALWLAAAAFQAALFCVINPKDTETIRRHADNGNEPRFPTTTPISIPNPNPSSFFLGLTQRCAPFEERHFM